jgi:membrane protein DedA with SNARE-associated domain
VLIGRFIAILRVTAAWLAGISHMPWWRFFFWNATGGILWATLVGVIAYYFGRAAAEAIGRYGLIGGAGAIGLAILIVAGIHFWRRRMLRAETES